MNFNFAREKRALILPANLFKSGEKSAIMINSMGNHPAIYRRVVFIEPVIENNNWNLPGFSAIRTRFPGANITTAEAAAVTRKSIN
ncbi:MAG TPA: hypothetical protein ENO10_04375, partial [Salinimicrobium catena]|nr:hypothetical protein [Salinimicrobium catena]